MTLIAHIFQLEKHKNIENYAYSFILFLHQNLTQDEFANHYFYFSYFENEDLKDSILKRLDGISFPMHKIKYFNDHYQMMKDINLVKYSDSIFHQMSSIKVFLFLFFHRNLNKQTSWVIWGGDLYHLFINKLGVKYKVYDFIVRRSVIKNLKNIMGIKEDFELLKTKYKTKANHFLSIYPIPSKIFSLDEYKKKHDKSIKILVAHSANRANNHKYIFEALLPFKNENIKITTPLSYGELDNIPKVVQMGYNLFEEKFEPINTFMKPEEFSELLKEINVAVFAIERQAAVGILITLISLGKKIYFKKGVVPYTFFTNNNIKIFDTNILSNQDYEKFIYMEEKDKINNIKEINKLYSDDNIISIWRTIFDS